MGKACHLCKHYGKGSDECIRCQGPPELTQVGHKFVSLDAIPAPEEFIYSEGMNHGMMENQERQGVTRDLAPEVECALMHVIATLFAAMRPDGNDYDLRIFFHLYSGESTIETARKIGVSDECVRKRLKRLAERSSIAKYMVDRITRANGAGRKRGERKDGTFQPDLFG